MQKTFLQDLHSISQAKHNFLSQKLQELEPAGPEQRHLTPVCSVFAFDPMKNRENIFFLADNTVNGKGDVTEPGGAFASGRGVKGFFGVAGDLLHCLLELEPPRMVFPDER